MRNEVLKLCVYVKNLPDYELKQYIVVRYVDGEFWFYGTYETYDRADEVAKQLGNGLALGVLNNEEHKDE